MFVSEMCRQSQNVDGCFIFIFIQHKKLYFCVMMLEQKYHTVKTTPQQVKVLHLSKSTDVLPPKCTLYKYSTQHMKHQFSERAFRFSVIFKVTSN